MSLQADEYASRVESVGHWKMRVVSYKLGDTFVCKVDNVDPGATIARATSETRKAAEEEATKKAKRRLERTTRHSVGE